jgi:hypothetical protein
MRIPMRQAYPICMAAATWRAGPPLPRPDMAAGNALLYVPARRQLSARARILFRPRFER